MRVLLIALLAAISYAQTDDSAEMWVSLEGWTLTASSSHPGMIISNIQSIDNTQDFHFGIGAGGEQWVKLEHTEMQGPFDALRMRLQTWAYPVNNYRIETSSDGANWDSVMEGTGDPNFTTDQQWQTFEFPSAVTTQFLRFVLVDFPAGEGQRAFGYTELRGAFRTPRPSHSPTLGMPSQAPTYHGPQINAHIDWYNDSSCSIRSSDGSKMVHVPRGFCYDFPYDPNYPDDEGSEKYECLRETGIILTRYNETSCMVARDVQTFPVGQCIVADTEDDGKPIGWLKLSQLQGCGSKKSESFFNLENSLLVSGGCLIFVFIVGFAILYYCRKEKNDSPYSNLQN